ncbi:MAG: hypothetical protein HUK09_04530 [Bacteroidaceae bacterium]|nr:hypothetical protein [Bacteroidaceae bacterium]
MKFLPTFLNLLPTFLKSPPTTTIVRGIFLSPNASAFHFYGVRDAQNPPSEFNISGADFAFQNAMFLHGFYAQGYGGVRQFEGVRGRRCREIFVYLR